MRNRYLLISAIYVLLCASCTTNYKSPREIADFNFGWKFHLGEIEQAKEVDYNDDFWQDVRLPHDWSVEHSFTQQEAGGATAWLPGGIGWYRKRFDVPTSSSDKVVWIEFDGVYTNAEVWINGHYLGKRPFGYASFSYNLSKYLNFGASNTIAVKADRSAYLDSRWYPGSGIYRNVKLVTTNKTHIPQWGTFVTTPTVTKEEATIEVQTTVNSIGKNAVLRSTILFNNVKVEVSEQVLENAVSNTSIQLQNPKLWDTQTPHMYNLLSEVFEDGTLVDQYTTPFGIRSFEYNAETGFFLNGNNTLFKGVCLHHDGGLVGAAVPKDVWRRRLERLKEAGCNAIRTAHNPPSEEFLDLCDEMGFLVQDEVFDEFQNPKDKRKNYNQGSEDTETKGYAEHFDEWKKRDLQSVIMRDRNHPSIVMWSIGNEIEWTFPNYGSATGYWGSNKVGDVNYYWDEPPFSPQTIKSNFAKNKEEDICAKTAQQLSKWLKELDQTRPVTANLVIPSVSMISGYADALDIVGLSYRNAVYDYCRKNYPDKVILGTENWTRYHEWKPVVDNSYMSGIFLWTGINYMGESRSWPVRGSGSGLLDFAGFDKPSYHMFKTLWNTEPHVYITTQTLALSPYKLDDKQSEVIEKEEGWAKHQKWGWQDVNAHWNYSDGDSVMVEVYTNQPEVELFLNNTSYGVKRLADVDDHIIKWMVPYSDGNLKAIATNKSTHCELITAGKVTNFAISADRETMQANSYDVAHIEVQLLDSKGNPVKNEESDIEFEISGPVKLLGVDNGAPNSVQDYQSNTITTANGRCLLIVQALSNKGNVTIIVKANGIEQSFVEIECK